jgi:hypothetical protein
LAALPVERHLLNTALLPLPPPQGSIIMSSPDDGPQVLRIKAQIINPNAKP